MIFILSLEGGGEQLSYNCTYLYVIHIKVCKKRDKDFEVSSQKLGDTINIV